MQGELFQISGAAVEPSKVSVSHPSWVDPFRVTLRLDHLSVLSISALVLYVLVFSFGVEKGKRIGIRELEAEKVKRETLARELSQGEALVEVPEVQPAKEVGRYTIQVITFLSQSQAEEKVKKLKEKGYQSFIIPGGKFFQVCVDRFENMTEARQRLLRLRSEGFAPPDAYIRPLKAQISI